MGWVRSRVAWAATVVALFGLLRALRRLVDVDERPLALVVAVLVVAAAAAVPTSFGRRPVAPGQAGWRKMAQLFGAGAVTALCVLLGVGVVLAGVLGVVTAVAVPLVWRVPTAAP